MADGTGSSRKSAAFLLWVISSFLIGLYLFIFGRRYRRITCSVATALAVQAIVYPATLNLDNGKISDIVIWIICAAFGLLGAAIGLLFWRLGWICIGLNAGVALAYSVLIFGHNLTIENAIGRWCFVGALALIMAAFVAFTRYYGVALATATTGSFLFFLAVDLCANFDRGMSAGLRFLLDHKDPHPTEYHALSNSRVTLALSWGFILIGYYLQWYIYRQYGPFVNKPNSEYTTQQPSNTTLWQNGRNIESSCGTSTQVDPPQDNVSIKPAGRESPSAYRARPTGLARNNSEVRTMDMALSEAGTATEYQDMVQVRPISYHGFRPWDPSDLHGEPDEPPPIPILRADLDEEIATARADSVSTARVDSVTPRPPERSHEQGGTGVHYLAAQTTEEPRISLEESTNTHTSQGSRKNPSTVSSFKGKFKEVFRMSLNPSKHPPGSRVPH